jgi:transcriptional regulator with XRE-family HTH domain
VAQEEMVRPAPADLSDDEILKELGLRLLVLRRAKGYQLQQVADITGIGISTLSRYENGKADLPSLPKLLKLAEVYGSSAAWLFSDFGATRVFPNGEVPVFTLLDGKGAGDRPIQANLFLHGLDDQMFD